VVLLRVLRCARCCRVVLLRVLLQQLSSAYQFF